MRREIRIVGGGLAGLTLGLLLRRDGVPVRIFDAGSYPRQKVCGEFVSGQGIQILEALGLFPPAVTHRAATVQFFNASNGSTHFKLPEPAVVIDRATLDATLAHAFQSQGGELKVNTRWNDSFVQEGLVRATGRRLRRDGSPAMVGLKAHARDLPLSADLEMHFSEAGYIGLARQTGGTVNVCALFRSKRTNSSARDSGRDLVQMFSSEMGESIQARLEKATFENATFAAVAGISLCTERASATAECRIGDSICMIPPMTGNGMSIALESASIAAPILREFSLGKLGWAAAQTAISRQCDRKFRRRLAIAGILQRACFSPAGRRMIHFAIRIVPPALRGTFRLTR